MDLFELEAGALPAWAGKHRGLCKDPRLRLSSKGFAFSLISAQRQKVNCFGLPRDSLTIQPLKTPPAKQLHATVECRTAAGNDLIRAVGSSLEAEPAFIAKKQDALIGVCTTCWHAGIMHRLSETALQELF
jgi:hypothetical protein